MGNKRTIYFAGGCFWGTEHFMKLLNGVIETQVGYANSRISNPSYECVKSGATQAAETVKVDYDADIIGLKQLIELYFKTIDPTSINRQGEDSGTQYRTGIYFSHLEDEQTIRTTVDQLAANYDKPLVIEIVPLQNFYPAEDYHQNYLDKNPSGYCHIAPELFDMARKANRH